MCLPNGTNTWLARTTCAVKHEETCKTGEHTASQSITFNDHATITLGGGSTTNGEFVADLSYTCPRAEFCYISWIVHDPYGGRPAAGEYEVRGPSGKFPFRHFTTCWPEGSYRVELSIRSCLGKEHGQGAITVGPLKPMVSLSEGPTTSNGQRQALVKWSFPRPVGSHRVRVETVPDGSEVWEPYFGVAQTGEQLLPLPSCVGKSKIRMRAIAVACQDNENGRAVSENEFLLPGCELSCDTCDGANSPTCVGNPVHVQSGNMRLPDSDPLPGGLAAPLERVYDSKQAGGRFGLGWSSIFDAWLQPYGYQQEEVMLGMPGGDHAVYRRVGGVWLRVAPTTRYTPESLTYDAATNEYRHRPEKSDVVYIFKNGKIVRLESLSQGTATIIEWDAAGRPVRLYDRDGRGSWTITSDASNYIESIAVDGTNTVWTYTRTSGFLTSVQVNGSQWRSYTPAPGGIAAAYDASGNLIESHVYVNGRAVTSLGDAGDITNVEYDLPGNVPGERRTRVTYASGRTTDFLSRVIAGELRTVQIDGSCDCGSEDSAYAYDAKGRLVRKQGADGYVTAWTYTGAHMTVEETNMTPSGCDPATDPLHCRLSPDALSGIGLLATPASQRVTYGYTDPNWPDRPTRVATTSLLQPNDSKSTSWTYDATTGTVLTETVRGWTGSPPRNETRTTTTTLYDGTTAAPFAPGGSFQTSWLTEQPAGLPRSVDGPRSDVADATDFVYYPRGASVPALLRGRLAAKRNAAGHIVRYEDYDAFGNARRIIDANGVVRSLTFDHLGRLVTSTTEPVANCDTAIDPLCDDPLTMTQSYYGAGALKSSTQPGGGVAVYEYDSRGRTKSISRGPAENDLRERIAYTYDDTGAIMSGKTASERKLANVNGTWVEKMITTYLYDTSARLRSRTHADGKSVTYSYDEEGRIASLQDENHTAPNTFYDYDPAGRIESVIQKLQKATGLADVVTQYAYDAHGNMRSVTDANGNVTTYTYDDFGQMLRQESPVTGVTTYTYDATGNLVSSTDANNATTTRTYDALGRMTTSVSTRGTASETTTWQYDTGTFGLGGVGKMTDTTGTTEFRHDRRGLVLEEQKMIEGTTYTTRFGHDADGNRTRIVYPSGRIVTTVFDYAGRPVAMPGFVTSAEYLPFGPLTKLEYANGTTRVASYDNRYRILTNDLVNGSAPLASYLYGYDDAGNITSITDQQNAAYNRAFAYDDLNRLTIANSGSALWGTGSFTYDDMGNLQSRVVGTSSTTFVRSGATPKLANVTEGGVTRNVTYDAAGNETGVGTNAFTYTPRNHVSSADGASYQYDGRGIRTVTLFPLAVAALTSSKPSPQRAGWAVTWTTTASGGQGTYEYRYWYRNTSGNDWIEARAWSTSPTWTWGVTPDRVGIYEIRAFVRMAGSTTFQSRSMIFEWILGPQAVVDSVTSNVPSPQRPGVAVTFTGHGSAGESPLEYHFKYRSTSSTNWIESRGWNANASWTWNVDPTKIGTYEVMVSARSAGAYFPEGTRTVPFEWILGPQATLTSITADKPSPSQLTTHVTFTATASGGETPHSFEFKYRRQGTTQWLDGRGWNVSPSWTTALQPGTWEIRAGVRSTGGTYLESSAITTFTNAAPASITSFSADKPSPQTVGTAITWTAVAAGGVPPLEYQFEHLAGTTWTVLQSWSPTSTFAWTPQTGETGEQSFRVYVRSIGSTHPFEDVETASITIVEALSATLAPRPVLCASGALAPCLTAMTSAADVTALALGDPARYSLYSPELSLLAETAKTTAANKPIAYEYIWFAGQPLAQIEVATNTTHYYFNDHLGTPVLTTDTTGTIDWRIERDPYGKPYATRAGASRYQPLAFPGQEETGTGELSYNIFRWYRSGWGRYTQSDPLSPMAGASEPYRYVQSNPILSADPLGLFQYRKTYDHVKLEEGKCGSTGLKLDIEWKCDNSGGCEKLTFVVPVIFTIRYDNYASFEHELKHVELHEQYLHAGAVKTLTPAESKGYANFFDCRAAALNAIDAFWKAVDPFNFKQSLKHFWHDVTDPGCH